MKLGDVGARRMLVQPDDVSAKLGELPDDMGPDARRAPSHHGTATVVTQQLLNLTQVSNNFRYHGCCAFCSLARCAAWTRPSLISAMASGISLAVNFPPRPVGKPPNE